MAQFKFFHPTEVRYGDLDPQGHVNNAKHLTYFEHARVQYFVELGLFRKEQAFMEIGVIVAELKALFFVKTFAGNPHHEEPSDFQGEKPPAGRRIRVIFKDGEIMSGTTQGFDRSRPGFFVVPVARGSNNERCFVVTAATEKVAFVE